MYKQRRAFSIAKSIGLGSEELNRPCEDYLFPKLADNFHPWREVFASLLTQVDLDDIDSENYGRSEQIKRIAALRKWKEKCGRGATYEILVRALLNIGKVDQAETMCNQLLLAHQGTVHVLKLHNVHANPLVQQMSLININSYQQCIH